MVSKKFKVLEVKNGTEYVFSSFAFKKCVNAYKSKEKNAGKNTSVEQIYEAIADSAHVSVDAVKNWMYGKNGPADLETVKDLATTLNVDYMELLKIQEEKTMSEKNMEMNMSMNVVTDMDKTKDVIRVVYQKMSAFMDAAVEELCFDSSEEVYWEYDEAYKDIIRTLHASMLDIPLGIYDRLREVIEETLFLYIYGIPDGPLDIWELGDFDDFCKNEKIEGYIAKVYYMQKESNDFYAKMREILKDYLLA